MAKAITDYAPGIKATAVTSGASVVNARKVGNLDAEFGLMQNDVAYFA